MGDALLPELASNPSDLLPTNTQIFSSTVSYGRPFYIVAILSAIVSVSCLFAGMSSGSVANYAVAVAIA